MKLIWEYYKTDGCSYGFTIPIPFEYSSKEDFCFEVLERCNEAKKTMFQWPTIDLLGIEFIPIQDLESIEHEVFTLEEWFNKNRVYVLFK